MTRNLILVTGAPRTATTPVGNMLETAQSTVSLYEPLGPTGLKRFQDWFPMNGEAGPKISRSCSTTCAGSKAAA